MTGRSSGSTDAAASTVRETLALVVGRPIVPDDPFCRDAQPDWDSLKHIELVFALEDAFDIRFEADEIGYLTDVRSILDRVARHGGG